MEQSGGVEIDKDIPIAQLLELIKKQVRRRKGEKGIKKTVDNGSSPNENIILEERTVDNGSSPYENYEYFTLEETTAASVFSNSAEDFLTYINAVSVLCGDLGMADFDPAEVERFTSSISFVRDSLHLNYPSRAIRFACENESMAGKDVMDEMILPSLSSANVQKKSTGNGKVVSSAPSEDFVLNVGGSVWALDWCPRVESSSHGNIVREFIAVSTHPPDSSYHKLGETLEGRGVVQIWCLLHTPGKDGEPSLYKTSKEQERRGRPRKQPLDESAEIEVSKKPRGRPRNKPSTECNNQSSQTLGELSNLRSLVEDGEASLYETSKKQERRGRPRKQPLNESAEKEDSKKQERRGRPRKQPLDESIENSKKPKGRPRKMPLIECNIQSSQTRDVQCLGEPSNLLFLREDGEPSLYKKSKKQKGRGRSRKQPLDESAGKEDSRKPKGLRKMPSTECKNQSSETLDVQCLGEPSNLLTLDAASSNLHEQVPGEGTELHSEGTENNSLSTGAKVRKSRYKARETAQVPESETPICMVDASMECSDPQTSRKQPLDESAGKEDSKKSKRPTEMPLIECNNRSSQTLDVQCLGEPSNLLTLGVASANLHEQVFGEGTEVHSEVTENKSQVPESDVPICMVDASMEFSDPQTSGRFIRTEVGEGTAVGQAAECVVRRPPPHSLAGNGSATASHFCDNRLTKECIPKNVSLPRMVLCLSHNGKVTWDVKWRPSAIYNKRRMGYLAVLLGNGALEVWDVPLPRTVQVIYRSCQENGIDPRFLKLEPVFRCSGIKFGNRHSIPLTLEWSTSWPNDMILAGCHDGTVAVWKFCASGSSLDTRPLLCFSADSVPIRAISWAPTESVAESSNVIVTAGHKGLKFWDIRDPFRPLWDFPLQRIVYSLDWLAGPRCIITSLDDGSLRILSLANAANCLPVTGTRFTGTPQQGFFSYMCSPSPIWSIHASTVTGMVAYCSADGTALSFQMTQKAVGKDPHRNRGPHFLCGSVIEEEDSFFTIFTPLPDTPFPMRKSLNEWGDTPRSMRGFLIRYGQDKRAKSNNNNNNTDAASESSNSLALCYGGEIGAEGGYDNSMAGQSSNKQGRTKKKVNNEQLAVAVVDEDTEEAEKRGSGQKEIMKEDDDDDDMGNLPPKNVAMHRVRWNRNKGSENWLCYGGAAGILRCQAVGMYGG